MEFEEYLREMHSSLFPEIDGDSQTHFEQWIADLNSRDYIKYASEALQRVELQRNERILEIMADRKEVSND
jgi:RNA processing factor Prp31